MAEVAEPDPDAWDDDTPPRRRWPGWLRTIVVGVYIAVVGPILSFCVLAVSLQARPNLGGVVGGVLGLVLILPGLLVILAGAAWLVVRVIRRRAHASAG